MIVQPPKSTRKDTTFHYTTRFRSVAGVASGNAGVTVVDTSHARARDQGTPAVPEPGQQPEPQAQGVGAGVSTEGIIIDLLMAQAGIPCQLQRWRDRKSTRLNSSH